MNVFSYIISLGASVMMPIIFSILGICLGIKLKDALRSGLYVGVGFVGLSVITNLLTENLGPAVNQLAANYGLNLSVLDIGWPAAAGIAYGSSVGAIVIPVCLGINILMLITKTTKTVNIDIWNYWHFAFVGAIVAVTTETMIWGLFAAVICYIITMILADYTAPKVEKFYENMEGISMPQPFCQAYSPFAEVINKGLDVIPGINKVNIDADGMKKKFGLLGEPIFLGVIVGALLAIFAGYPVDKTLKLGIIMGAVMELIPRITRLFIEGLVPISDATKRIIDKKFKKSAGLYIGMSPALVIGHPATLVVSLLLIPCIIFLSVALPGNEFLPLTSLAGLLYVPVMILPFTKGNVFKTFIIALIMLVAGNYIVTNLAPVFTEAAKLTEAAMIPEGTKYVASIDFAASPLTWVIYHLSSMKEIGAGILILLTGGLMFWNRSKIVKQNKLHALQESQRENDTNESN